MNTGIIAEENEMQWIQIGMKGMVSMVMTHYVRARMAIDG